MNNFIKTVNNHRTIREFKDRPVTKEILESIFEAIMRTATSTGGQYASVIRVTDPKKRKAISEVSKQDYLARAPELVIFIADNYRNIRIAEDAGHRVRTESDVDKFIQAITDAVLMAQNANNIIESLGMGAVFLGSILNNAEKMIEILALPKMTFPILGLAFGYPNQEPDLKPRMKKEFRVFENEYKIFDNYMEELKDYDEEMTTYYDLRNSNQRLDKFSNQIIKGFENINPMRNEILNIARKNGYKL